MNAATEKLFAASETTSDEDRPASGVMVAARYVSGPNGFVSRPEERPSMKPLLEEVTLVVYGWRSVEPGTLAWVFPSLGAAVVAAHAMRNAVQWIIVRGRRASDGVDVNAERQEGAVLVEQCE
jgi:hypothetical protein